MSNMIYLDTNIFLYAVLNDGKIGVDCRKLLTRIAKKEQDGCTSLLTWDEFVYNLKKKVGKEAALQEGLKLLTFFNMSFLKVDKTIIFKAQDFMEEYNLNPRDAIHAATAIIYRVDGIVTDDTDFNKVNELKRIKLE